MYILCPLKTKIAASWNNLLSYSTTAINFDLWEFFSPIRCVVIPTKIECNIIWLFSLWFQKNTMLSSSTINKLSQFTFDLVFFLSCRNLSTSNRVSPIPRPKLLKSTLFSRWMDSPEIWNQQFFNNCTVYTNQSLKNDAVD